MILRLEVKEQELQAKQEEIKAEEKRLHIVHSLIHPFSVHQCTSCLLRKEEEIQTQQQQLQHDREELKTDKESYGLSVFHGLLQIIRISSINNLILPCSFICFECVYLL